MTEVDIQRVVGQVLSPGKFFVPRTASLRVEFEPDREYRWELFRGHLLDAAMTRRTERFDAWHVRLENAGADEPLVSLLWQRTTGRMFVTRQILTYGYEAYEESPGVIESRPVEKWQRELIGTVGIGEHAPQSLTDELGANVTLAVVGTSRLPITSLESPLPAFSLGQLAYSRSLPAADRPWVDPIGYFEAVVEHSLCLAEQAQALETSLRSGADTRALASAIAKLAPSLPGSIFRTLFNGVALSPYTGFAERLVQALAELAQSHRRAEQVVDDLSYMLRHLCRHLTAFDLVLFHSFGANYPDALFLDTLLRAYVDLAASHSALFLDDGADSSATRRKKRIRRRALRQAALMRRSYEHHRVPDAPTSPGENARVLPAPFVRVNEQQIANKSDRRRRLYEEDPTENVVAPAQAVYAASLADLQSDDELIELGSAVFLDRPWGLFKEPGEPDRTPLVAYESFSPLVARRRLSELKSAGWIAANEAADCVARVASLAVSGIRATDYAAAERGGVVSLSDAAKVAPDFTFVRSSRTALVDFLGYYNLSSLTKSHADLVIWLVSDRVRLAIRDSRPPSAQCASVLLYDRELVPRVSIEFGPALGTPIYVERHGIELVRRLRLRDLHDPSKSPLDVELC